MQESPCSYCEPRGKKKLYAEKLIRYRCWIDDAPTTCSHCFILYCQPRFANRPLGELHTCNCNCNRNKKMISLSSVRSGGPARDGSRYGRGAGMSGVTPLAEPAVSPENWERRSAGRSLVLCLCGVRAPNPEQNRWGWIGRRVN